jgi:hypothetical protein
MYKIIKEFGQEYLKNTENNTFIPYSQSNTDYQAYLEWLAEGNEPEIIDLSNDII